MVNGSGPRCLEAEHAGEFFRSAYLVKLLIAAPVGGDVASVADRQEMIIRRFAKFVDDLERSSFLSLDAIRVDRVYDGDFFGRADLAHKLQGIVEIALDRHHFRAIHEALRHFSNRDFPGGKQDDATDAGTRRVGRRCRGSIAGRCANHRAGPFLHGLGDRHRHATVLERAGGIQPLVFHINLAAAPDAFAQPRAVDQRRRALVQRNDRCRFGNGKEFAVTRDDSPVVQCVLKRAHENVSTRIMRGCFLTQGSAAMLVSAFCICALVAS